MPTVNAQLHREQLLYVTNNLTAFKYFQIECVYRP